jgi:hypothetical protein
MTSKSCIRGEGIPASTGRAETRVAIMISIRYAPISVFACYMLASCGGGGSDDDLQQAAPITEMSASDQSVLAGDWPLATATRAFLIHNDMEWQQAWNERKASLTCLPTPMSYNQAACSAGAPPSIDFTTYALIGIVCQITWQFGTPTPMQIFSQDNGNSMVVEYTYSAMTRPTFNVPGARFFLIPKTGAQLIAHSKEV